MNLSERHKRFADYYIETLNGADSYIRAGYKTKTVESATANASRLLRNDNIKLYIEQRMREKANRRIMSQDRVLELLSLAAEGMTEEEVIVPYSQHRTYEVARKKISERDRLKALELLGKRYALFTDRVESTQDIVVEWAEDNSED